MADYYELTMNQERNGAEGRRLLLRTDGPCLPFRRAKDLSGDELSVFLFSELIPPLISAVLNWDAVAPCLGEEKSVYVSRHVGELSYFIGRLQEGEVLLDGDIYRARADYCRPLTPEEVVHWPRPVPSAEKPPEPVGAKRRKGIEGDTETVAAHGVLTSKGRSRAARTSRHG